MVESFPAARDAAFTLSSEQARAVVERAQREWGADRDVLPRCGTRSFGSTSVATPPTGANAGSQATIDRIEWDPALGGSDEEVRQVIDALAGWHLSL